METAPFGIWRSPISSELIVADTVALGETALDEDTIYWVEGRPKEAGRYVIMGRRASGEIRELTPPGFNARTRVHGGGAFFLAEGEIVFSNFAGKVAGGKAESIFQPEWSPDGQLYFISDRTGWWNLYRYDVDQPGAPVPVCPREAEFGVPQWVFRLSTYGFESATSIPISTRTVSTLRDWRSRQENSLPSRRLFPATNIFGSERTGRCFWVVRRRSPRPWPSWI